MTIRRHEIEDVTRIPMTWEAYLATDIVPSEYYGGELVIAPLPTPRHQRIVGDLFVALRATAPDGSHVTMGAGWSPPGVHEELGPDVMVQTGPVPDRPYEQTPLLVVEVLSTNRRDDLVGKIQRYAAWGAPTYWIIDPRDHLVLTYRNDDGIFVETGRHTAGSVDLTYDGAAVCIDIDDLLAL